MRVVLVDDEPGAIESLKELLLLLTPEIEIVATANSVREAKEVISAKHPDLVFLDIEMGDGLGVEVLEYFPRNLFKTIFVTAYDNYAIQALKLQAFDYLLKPLDPDELLEALKSAEKNKGTPASEPDNRLVSVSTQEGIQILKSDEIIRFQVEDNYTRIYLTNEKTILVSKTLKKFEEALDETSFIRVHYSHIVNFQKIKKVIKKEGLSIQLADGTSIPVIKTKRLLVEMALHSRTVRI